MTVVDREQQAQGFFYRVWRRLTLRGITQRRSLQSLRQALEQEALLAYAAIAAGANAPKLIATSELGPDAVMLVYEHIGGRTLDSLPDEEITDDLLRGAWRQVRGAAVAADRAPPAGRRRACWWIVPARCSSPICAAARSRPATCVLRMDIAQLLTTARAAGRRRAGGGRGASSVLGPDAVADCLPLLQPIALSRSTRATLRRLARERAQREREAVLEASPAAKRAARSEAAERRGAARTAADRKRAVAAGGEAGREAGHRRGAGRGPRGGPAHPDPPARCC